MPKHDQTDPQNWTDLVITDEHMNLARCEVIRRLIESKDDEHQRVVADVAGSGEFDELVKNAIYGNDDALSFGLAFRQIFLASFNSVLETMVIETAEEIAQKERENGHS
jgi:hypothetical protein